MTHPQRRDLADDLCERLGELAPRIVVDPEPDGPPTAVRTAAAAWNSAPSDATHHLVIQDDVHPSREFTSALADEVRSAPMCCLSLYAGWANRVGATARVAALTGRRRFLIEESFVPAPALILPTGLAREAGAYLNAHMADADLGDSTLLSSFLRRRGIPVEALTASLVQHDALGSPSLLAKSAAKGIRRAACFRDDITDHTDLDGLLARPPALPYVIPDNRRAVVDVGLPDGSWKTLHAAEWLEGRGYDDVLPPPVKPLVDEGGRVVASSSDLREAWLAAFCAGVLAGPGALPRSCEGSVAAVALRSLLPGSFRRGLTGPDVALLTDIGGPLIDDALERSRRS
ncbi:hypothetical protein [Streptomyces odontomachi]|uniref:hypothetical protein n=1 Tax=Streptomyces odontomachi TaxID=2944940 RepID=UPI00210A23B5|nr:hypothetical protein [Streptomyces sp. ODS25]